MAKISKKAEIIDKLNQLITKEAELAQTNISGVPLVDTKATSVSDSTETTDKNSVGPEKLNGEQGYEQKDSNDSSEPVAVAKSAEEKIDKLASSILDTINTKLAAQAQTGISGKPLADTKATSVSDSTETTDKNGVGPEKLNGDQGYEQKGSTDKSEPVKTTKKAEDSDAVKEASWQLGRQFCEVMLKKTAQIKVAKDLQDETELKKEAGRRDFDTLIAQAAAELETQQNYEAEQQKLAEYQGAVAFDELYKQAQIESLAQENQELRVKIAAYEEAQRQTLAKEAAVKEEEKLAKMAALVIEKLKGELLSTPAATAAK